MNIYEGTDDCIFVSYAHKDSERVMPILEAIEHENLGIMRRSDSTDDVPKQISSSRGLIFFDSPSSVNSDICIGEIGLALSHKKDILVVFLENMLYPDEYIDDLILHNSISRRSYTDDESFIKAVARECVSCFREKEPVTLADIVDFTNDLNAGLYYLLMENYLMAVLHLKEAAKQNNDRATYLLGVCYEEGKGVEQDYKKAAFWYKKAAEQGDSRAADKICELKRSGLI